MDRFKLKGSGEPGVGIGNKRMLPQFNQVFNNLS